MLEESFGFSLLSTAFSYSQDVNFTTFLADRLLKEYCESGTFTSANLLDHLGQSMMVSDRLTFLAKYREFHKLCEEVVVLLPNPILSL